MHDLDHIAAVLEGLIEDVSDQMFDQSVAQLEHLLDQPGYDWLAAYLADMRSERARRRADDRQGVMAWPQTPDGDPVDVPAPEIKTPPESVAELYNIYAGSVQALIESAVKAQALTVREGLAIQIAGIRDLVEQTLAIQPNPVLERGLGHLPAAAQRPKVNREILDLFLLRCAQEHVNPQIRPDVRSFKALVESARAKLHRFLAERGEA